MAKVYGIIYKATNKINGKSYIGQTIQPLNKRIIKHVNDALNNRYNSYFHKVIRKHGKKNFIWEVIAKCNSIEELNKMEVEMIKRHNAINKGYNLTEGGEGRVGCKHTEKSKKKMSEQNKGEKNGMYGKHHSEKTKKKMSESRKGKKSFWYGKHLTEETRRKISESRIGEKNCNYGKKFSIEIRQRMSKATKGRYIGSKNFRAKKYVITTPKGEEIFVHGISNFCRNYTKEKIYSGNLIKVAQGKQKQYKGYKCRYWEEKINE